MEWKMKLKISYSRVHISSDEVFSKILKKPSIVQKKTIPHMKGKVVFIGKKPFFLKVSFIRESRVSNIQ